MVAVVLGMIEKYLAMVVSSVAASARQGRRLGSEYGGENVSEAISFVFSEIESATFWPLKPLVRRGLKQVQDGDLTSSAKSMFRWVQVQSLLVIGEVVCLLWAIYVLVSQVANRG